MPATATATSFLSLIAPDVLLVHEGPLADLLPALQQEAALTPPVGHGQWQTWYEAQWANGVRAASVSPHAGDLAGALAGGIRRISIPYLTDPVAAVPDAWASVAISCPLEDLLDPDPMTAISSRVTLDPARCPFNAFRILGGVVRGRFPRSVYLEVFNG
jgi:hypothetical protein